MIYGEKEIKDTVIDGELNPNYENFFYSKIE
jgi:hypothetical protein